MRCEAVICTNGQRSQKTRQRALTGGLSKSLHLSFYACAIKWERTLWTYNQPVTSKADGSTAKDTESHLFLKIW